MERCLREGGEWRELSEKREEEKTKRKREKDNSHMREKREKENKIILNIWRGVVSLAGVKHWFYASSGPNVFSLFLILLNSIKHEKLSLHMIFHWNKQSIPIRNIYQRVVSIGHIENKRLWQA